MISIASTDRSYVFTIKGLHQLWCFKRKIEIQKEQLVSVKPLEGPVIPLMSLRFPGTHFPGIITAGTFYSKGSKTFCDVTNKSTALVFELKNGPYSRIVANVDNLQEALSLLTS